MRRSLFMLAAFFIVLPSLALAQSYQHTSDGLVAVHVKKIVTEDRSTGFDVCAQLMRQEEVAPLEVRLNFWGTSGGLLAQTSSSLHPEYSVPACQRIALPAAARGFGRWEVSRLHFRRDANAGTYANSLTSTPSKDPDRLTSLRD